MQFRNGKPLPLMENKIVVIVDDGIATGSTLVPALQLCRKRKAGKVVVAAPVSGKRCVSEVSNSADEIRILVQPDHFFSVSQVYEDFHTPSDEEVKGYLTDFEHKRLSYG